MTLRLDDRWVWDFWFAQDGRDVHVFYMQAPRALGDPERRHHNARIGHAVSTDLRSWTVLPDPLPEASPGGYDDLATWTGSIARDHDGIWQLVYTGCRVSEGGRIQRILRAASPDLQSFRRIDGVVVEADPRWYEKLGDPQSESEEHWRDPWLFWDDATAAWHLLITARANRGPFDGRGVIGHASSPDLEHWTVLPPLSEPGELRQMEVPQLVEIGDRHRILFSANDVDDSAARRARIGTPGGGSHFLVSDDRFGPYRIEADAYFAADQLLHLYAGRLLEHEGRWWFVGWETHGADGRFDGVLGDPLPVTVDPDGTLRVSRTDRPPDPLGMRRDVDVPDSQV